MRTLYPGHRYALANLKSGGEQVLQFRQDPPLHPLVEGTCCQEVIRALIDRVQVLDAEKPWEGNHSVIIPGLRRALAGFEARALLRKVEKGTLEIETMPVGDDGHLIFEAIAALGAAVKAVTRARDSNSDPKGENSRSEVECEASQSGRSEAEASPND